MKRCCRSSLALSKTARFSLKDSAKTLSSLCMFWASAPKRYKGKNILDLTAPFAETVSAMVSGDGHVDFMDQASIPFLTSGTWLEPFLLT